MVRRAAVSGKATHRGGRYIRADTYVNKCCRTIQVIRATAAVPPRSRLQSAAPPRRRRPRADGHPRGPRPLGVGAVRAPDPSGRAKLGGGEATPILAVSPRRNAPPTTAARPPAGAMPCRAPRGVGATPSLCFSRFPSHPIRSVAVPLSPPDPAFLRRWCSPLSLSLPFPPHARLQGRAAPAASRGMRPSAHAHCRLERRAAPAT